MTPIKKLFLNALLATAVSACGNVFADDVIDADDFVEDASAKGLAEIESSKLALEKTNSAEVRKFAQTMIEDHTKANEELAAIARTKKLDVSDDPELMNQAKAMVLKVRHGESFDEAYANNQVMAHKETIKLFQNAANLKDAELKAFAQKTLPKLQHHLDMALKLQAAKTRMHDKDKKDEKHHERDGKTGTGAGTSERIPGATGTDDRKNGAGANTGERTDGTGTDAGGRVGGQAPLNDTTRN